MFHVKDFVSITAGMLNHVRATTRKITDFTVGSVVRTLLEATAVELDQLYQQMLRGLLAAIPVAVYRSFGFDILPAVSASGVVRLSIAAPAMAPLVFSQGTIVATASGVQYMTAAVATIGVGESSADVLVTALLPGGQGNVLPGEIVRLVSPSPAQQVAVANPAAITNGRGEETAEERRLRFVDYIRSLARGTIGALQYAARRPTILDPETGLVLERVARVSVDEVPGYVVLYIHNGAGRTSPELVAAVARTVEGYRDQGTGAYVPGYRPVGMRVDVEAMQEVEVNVVLTVQAPPAARGTALEGRIAAAVAAVIRATASGGGLRPIDMVNATIGVPGVGGVEIVSPTLITPCGIGQVLVPGTITVSWA